MQGLAVFLPDCRKSSQSDTGGGRMVLIIADFLRIAASAGGRRRSLPL